MLTRVDGVLPAKERVLRRVMSSKKAKASTKDNWYQRALRDDPEGAATMREERALAAKTLRAQQKAAREAASAPAAAPAAGPTTEAVTVTSSGYLSRNMPCVSARVPSAPLGGRWRRGSARRVRRCTWPAARPHCLRPHFSRRPRLVGRPWPAPTRPLRPPAVRKILRNRVKIAGKVSQIVLRSQEIAGDRWIALDRAGSRWIALDRASDPPK